METESTSTKAQKYSDAIIGQFHPIVASFGFTESEWDYDPGLDIVRVQFRDPGRGNAVQIDRHVLKDVYSANYCRIEGDWQMCIEGKPKSLQALRATLSRWLLKYCEECQANPGEEKLAEA